MRIKCLVYLVAFALVACQSKNVQNIDGYRRLFLEYSKVLQESTARLRVKTSGEKAAVANILLIDSKIKEEELRKIASDVAALNDLNEDSIIGRQLLDLVLAEMVNSRTYQTVLQSSLKEELKLDALSRADEVLREVYKQLLPDLLKVLDIPEDYARVFRQV